MEALYDGHRKDSIRGAGMIDVKRGFFYNNHIGLNRRFFASPGMAPRKPTCPQGNGLYFMICRGQADKERKHG